MENNVGAIERQGASGNLWTGAKLIKSSGLQAVNAALIIYHSVNAVISTGRARSQELLSGILRNVMKNELMTF